MAESPEEMYARIVDQVGPAGRLPLPDMSEWVQFPWEVVDGRLAAAVLRPPLAEERTREGAPGGRPCRICDGSSTAPRIWENERFFVSMFTGPIGLPLVLFLQTREHLDYPDMNDDLAGECGQLSARLCRIMEHLEHIGRVHVCRYGDGSEHHHVWFVARPERFEQVIGSLAVEWDEILPPPPDDVRRADVALVARHLATHDGRALL